MHMNNVRKTKVAPRVLIPTTGHKLHNTTVIQSCLIHAPF